MYEVNEKACLYTFRLNIGHKYTIRVDKYL